MTASYRLIDYSLRPAKFAERNMLSEIFSRLSVFSDLSSYQYIGFGSIWYSDCVLFHKSLGVNNMISMERETDHEDRFTFNNPYKGIRLLMGPSSDNLVKIDWSRRSIIWFDYDDPLDKSILNDVRTIASRSISGTAFAVSVQAERLFDKREHHDEPHPIENPADFQSYFGEDRTPTDLSKASLRGWQLSQTSRKMILNEIESALSHINSSRPPDHQMRFVQVAAFEYADGAKMTTLVGVFVDEGQVGILESGNFRRLFFFSEEDTAFRIKVPMLTPREMRFLDQSLPIIGDDDIECGSIPPGDAKRYAQLYRYLPNFASFEAS